jgi:hypothetical protein
MHVNLLYIAKVEQARRDEERRAAANWRVIRPLFSLRLRPRSIRQLHKSSTASKSHSIQDKAALEYATQ